MDGDLTGAVQIRGRTSRGGRSLRGGGGVVIELLIAGAAGVGSTGICSTAPAMAS